jgi:phosphoribulokinase
MPRILNFKEIIARSPIIFTIGVAGDSGSGKTTFTNAIRQIFGPDLVGTITLDDYHIYDREERKQLNITPLNPDANNIARLESDVAWLKSGQEIEKPVYNHATGTFGPPVCRSHRKRSSSLKACTPSFRPACASSWISPSLSTRKKR